MSDICTWQLNILAINGPALSDDTEGEDGGLLWLDDAGNSAL